MKADCEQNLRFCFLEIVSIYNCIPEKKNPVLQIYNNCQQLECIGSENKGTKKVKHLQLCIELCPPPDLPSVELEQNLPSHLPKSTVELIPVKWSAEWQTLLSSLPESHFRSTSVCREQWMGDKAQSPARTKETPVSAGCSHFVISSKHWSGTELYQVQSCPELHTFKD